jgi:hypothetical protein
MARYIAVKEEHAELTKHEIRVIWGDFIKAQHVEAYPQLHGLVHKIMQLGSKARQTVDRETALACLRRSTNLLKSSGRSRVSRPSGCPHPSPFLKKWSCPSCNPMLRLLKVRGASLWPDFARAIMCCGWRAFPCPKNQGW